MTPGTKIMPTIRHTAVATLTLFAALILPSTGAGACSMRNIEIRQSDWHREGGYIRVVGELYNGCSDAAGVKLQAVFRDKAGRVILVSSFWPHSNRNIASQDTYAFSHLKKGGRSAESMTVRVTEVMD